MIHRRLFFLGMALCLARTAAAQDSGQIGVTMGYPGSIGIVWHLTDSIAVRPDFFFQATFLDSLSDDSATMVGIGVSGIFYLTKMDALRTYVVPRVSFRRTSSEYSYPIYAADLAASIQALGMTSRIATQSPTFESTSTSQQVSGAIGAQYSLHKRFSVFGEVGFGYSNLTQSFAGNVPIFPVEDSGPHSWATQSAVGIILYFKD